MNPQHTGVASGGATGDDEGRGLDGGGRSASENASAAAAAAGPPNPRRPLSRPAKPAARAARAPASARPRPCPRANDPARELAALEARAEEARELVRALEGRNQGLRASARDLADELASLRMLRTIDVSGAAAGAGGGAGHSGGGVSAADGPGDSVDGGVGVSGGVSMDSGGVGGGGVGVGGGSESAAAAALPAASSAAAGGSSDASRGSSGRHPLIWSETIERAYSRQLEAMLEGLGGGGGGGGGEHASPSPSSSSASPSPASASELFRASAVGQLGASQAEAAAALARLVAKSAAERPLGGGTRRQPARPSLLLEAALAGFRELVSRAAVALRRADVAAREGQGAGGADGGGGAAAAAAVQAEAASVAVDFMVAGTVLQFCHSAVVRLAALKNWCFFSFCAPPPLTNNTPPPPSRPPTPTNQNTQLDELVRHRLDDERSPPVPHEDHDLELARARAAARAARFSAEQRRALRSAFGTFRRNMRSASARARECARELAGGADDGGGGADPILPAAAPLLDSLEQSVAACAMHRALLASRLWSIVTPMQLCGLMADQWPFYCRAAPIAAVFEEEEEEEAAEEGAGAGRGVGVGGGGEGKAGARG